MLKRSRRKHFRVFSESTVKTKIWNERFNPKMDTIRTCFPNSRHFLIFKKVQGRPSPSSCVPVSVAEYTAISLNIPKCWWKCLNKLLWWCQGSAYAWSSYMFDRLLKMFPVLNVSGFRIWHSCMCNGYTEFWISLKKTQYQTLRIEPFLMRFRT